MPVFPKAKFEIVADDKTKKGVDSANSNLERLKKQISLTGVASVAAAGIGGLAVLTAAGIKLGTELAESSAKLGITTEALAGLRHAARLTGVEAGTLDSTLSKMTRSIAEAASGSGAANGALKELGLSAAELNRLTPDQQFAKIAEQLSKVGTQGDKARLAVDIFGRNTDILRTLDLGAAGLDQAAREAEKFGTALSRVQATQIDNAGDAIDRVKTATEGLSMQLAARFAPVITEAANNIADFIATVNEGISALTFFAERFLFLETSIQSKNLSELGATTELLTEKIAEMRVEYEKTVNLPSLVPGRGRQLERLSDEINRLNERLAEAQSRIREINAGGGETELSEILPGSLPQRKDNSGNQAALNRFAAERQKALDTELEGIFRREEAEAEASRRDAERRAAELDAIREGFKTREQIELEAFARRDQIIRDNMDAGIERDALLLANDQARAQFRIDLARYEQEEINRAVEEGIATREQWEKAAAISKAKFVLGSLQSLTAGVATHDKRMFALNKAAAIGNAIVNIHEGITKALAAAPPPFNIALAAITAAAGAAQISAIRSTSFGSGSTPSAVGSTPTLGGQPLPSQSSTAGGTSTREPNRIIEVTINGTVAGSDSVKKILQDLFDSDDVVIKGGSRQASTIRNGI
jgi:hypothetical protein